jgi:hypothetical protein
MRRFVLDPADGAGQPHFSILETLACFQGPTVSSSSSAQSSEDEQIGVQGAAGSQTTAVSGGNTGIVNASTGNVISGVNNTGSIEITSSDPEVVEAAIAGNTAIAGQAIVGSQVTTGAALADLQTEEEIAGETSQTAVAGGLNTATSALQYRAGQPVDQAVSSNPFGNLSPETVLVAIGVLLAAVYYITRRN